MFTRLAKIVDFKKKYKKYDFEQYCVTSASTKMENIIYFHQ